MTYQDHPVGTRRDPSPIPFGFVRATEYTRFLHDEEKARRLRAISPDVRTAMALAAPGADLQPYPLVAASPFVMQAKNEPEDTLRMGKFVKGQAAVPPPFSKETDLARRGPTRLSEDVLPEGAEEVNTVGNARSLTDTWVEYATSPRVSGTASVAEPYASPFKSKPSNPFTGPDVVGARVKENGKWSWRIMMAAAIAVVAVGIALIVLH